MAVAACTPSCKNIELDGRDGLKYFQHGVCSYFIPNLTRTNGGWWVSIARHLRIFYCFTTLVSNETKRIYGEALKLLLEAHHMIRNPLRKCDLILYRDHFTKLISSLINICVPFSKSGCKSIKFHQPYHWYLTRLEIGCSAMEKSLERMLGETQKRPFKFTNSRFDVEVCSNCIYTSYNTLHLSSLIDINPLLVSFFVVIDVQ